MIFMEEEKKLTVQFEEDDGEDRDSKKVTLADIEAQEKAAEEAAKPVLTKEEQKLRDKKQNKITAMIMGGIVGVVVIAGIIVAALKGKAIIRELPFATDGKLAVDETDIDFKDGEWYVANQQCYGMKGRALEMASVYDKPTSYGNSILTLNVDDEVILMGDAAVTKTNELLDWYYIKVGDKKGFIKTDYIAVKGNYDVVEIEEVEEEDTEAEIEEDESRHDFYLHKLAEDVVKMTNETNQKSQIADRYSELSNKCIRLRRQINDKIYFTEDEEGNEIEISDYEYSPEELMELMQELEDAEKELEEVKEEMNK